MNSLGERMKENYEFRSRIKLARRIPVIIRLDGKAFHTLTRKCEKPFDDLFRNVMEETALALCREIQGVKCAYTQSDEISLLLTDFDRLGTEAWFDYNLQKITSVSAGIASVCFSKLWAEAEGIFDSRAFNAPKEEVCNIRGKKNENNACR
ncbi:MAG: tRNA(His) guanylyltransferase Thg1 family protein [Desulfobacteraceae bacterium]|jgi:tRNA(His) 5'-end guanylyltransferase